MSEPLVIPVPAGEIFKPSETTTVRGGGTRLVKLVPIGDEGRAFFGVDSMPCIWRSHAITDGVDKFGNPIKVNECLLLACKDPPTVLPAVVDINSWKQFTEVPIEW